MEEQTCKHPDHRLVKGKIIPDEGSDEYKDGSYYNVECDDGNAATEGHGGGLLWKCEKGVWVKQPICKSNISHRLFSLARKLFC